LLKLQGAKFAMKVQNQKIFKLQRRKLKKIFTGEKPEMIYITRDQVLLTHENQLSLVLFSSSTFFVIYFKKSLVLVFLNPLIASRGTFLCNLI